jgi:hypothetical protein
VSHRRGKPHRFKRTVSSLFVAGDYKLMGGKFSRGAILGLVMIVCGAL